MKKLFRRFFRHIKEGFIGVKRHFAMAVSSMSAVTITLTMVGVFAVIAVNVATLSQEIEKSISLVALIDYDVDNYTQINAMRTEIVNMEGIENVEFRTKDQEFDYYNEQYPDMIEFSELYREDNPFHDTFIINVKDGTSLSDVKNKIARINGIDSVEDGGTNTYALINVLHDARFAVAILVIALIALAIYLIYNTIKVTIATRKDEIIIMRNVGARNGYIRAPFLVEGIIIGMFGSVIPIAIIAYGYYRLFTTTGGILAGVMSLIPVTPFIFYVSIGLLIIGIFVGFIGSYISVCKYLRLTR